ncbi:MAG: DUF503 domain-containing protein [Magnetococcales bacterium]|nr:DUF503 domain-containing protein [Magnetococcales bacterium]MBF0149376.1 DUF503 domain-containing protein [Magnetococcales bacterium]MBF0173022.1 DUF503 domain-containing protein [Magnetococcales bacterium]MBF0630915.1 DUF503 domain-containing protein [Magnetococcales bacterium]
MTRVGLLEVRLALHGIGSLKAKRGIIKGLMERTRNRFHVAVAEVGSQDLWGTADLGIAAVSSDAVLLQGLMEKVVRFIEEQGAAVIVDYRVEIL